METINIPNTNSAYNKMLYWFFSFPYKEVTLNSLVKQLKVSKTTASKIITQFVKERFIIKEIIGRNWVLKCNIDHEYNKSKKIPYNLEMIQKSEIIKKINENTPNFKAIVLFGSYRKGDDAEKSDIDIAVEVIGNKKLEIKKILTFKKFGYRKNIDVNLHIFSGNNINSNLFANIINGIVLDGFLEVKK